LEEAKDITMAKKEMNSIQKKESPKSKKDNDDDNDSRVKSVNAFDLLKLNYDDMAKLTINNKVRNKEQIILNNYKFTVDENKNVETINLD
jgi:hypothetical protein